MTKVFQVVSNIGGGGAEVLARTLNEHLNAEGVDSTLVCLTSSQWQETRENEISFKQSSALSISSLWRLRRVINSCDDDDIVVHGHLVHALYLLPIALAFTGVKLVFTEHSTSNRRRRYPFLALIESLFYRRYERIVCISNAVRETLSEWLGTRITDRKLVIIHNGSRSFEACNRCSTKSSKLSLLFVGRLAKVKGADTAIDAYSLLGNDFGELYVVGSGPLMGELRTKSIDLGLSDQVVFSGWVDEVELFFRSADIFVHPAREEGFGLAVVEALSAGLPVVCSDVGGLREVTKGCDSVFLCRPNQPREFAAAISKVKRMLDAGYDFSGPAMAHARQYSLEKMLQEHIKLYTDI